MTSMKALGLAIGIAFAASSFALAQQGNPPNNPPAQQANPTNPAASGTQQSNPTNSPTASRTIHRTGTAANRQRVSNQHRRVAARRRAARRLYAFQPSPGCRLIRVGNNLFRRVCR
jgi:hypothetical protein